MCVVSCQITRFHFVWSVAQKKRSRGVIRCLLCNVTFYLLLWHKIKSSTGFIRKTNPETKVPPLLLKARFPDQQMLPFFNNLKQDSGNYEGSNQGWVKDYTHWFVIDEVQCESWKCFRKSLQSMKSRFVCSI